MVFASKVSGNKTILDIIRVSSGVCSKSFIIAEIFDKTGVIVSDSCVYNYQKKLGVI